MDAELIRGKGCDFFLPQDSTNQFQGLRVYVKWKLVAFDEVERKPNFVA